jgi:hypothetical protein
MLRCRGISHEKESHKKQTMSDTKQKTGGGGGGAKRPRRQGGNGSDDDGDDAYHQAYARVRFHPIASSGRPGTPHCYFAESYAVEEIQDDDDKVVLDDDNDVSQQAELQRQQQQQKQQPPIKPHRQVVHKHANGLVIVTPGGPDWLSSASSLAAMTTASASASIPSPANATELETATKAADAEDMMMMTMTVESIDFKVKEAAVASQNAACKRKHQGKMLKGKRQVQQEAGVVRPNDVLAVVKVVVQKNKSSNSSSANNTDITDGDSNKQESPGAGAAASIQIPLSCCVWGTILERNHINLQQNPALLQHDPLLDGYLAVVLPTGPFPPPSSIVP